jgi:hypothetical protein
MTLSRAQRRRKLLALAPFVLSALTIRPLLNTEMDFLHAVAAYTVRSLQLVIGAVIASIDVLMRRRCVFVARKWWCLGVQQSGIGSFLIRIGVLVRY